MRQGPESADDEWVEFPVRAGREGHPEPLVELFRQQPSLEGRLVQALGDDRPVCFRRPQAGSSPRDPPA